MHEHHIETTPQETTVRVGHHELVIRRRYALLSIGNDILIGLWFLIGSFFFFSERLVFLGTCLFVIGSVEMLVRPLIRLARQLHIQRIRGTAPEHATWDF